jgi:hypothetical protein
MQRETKKILIGTAIIVLVGAIVVYVKLQATRDVVSPSPVDVPLSEGYDARTIAKNKLEDLDSPSAPFHWISMTDVSQGVSFERPNRLPVESKYSTFEFRGIEVAPGTFSCKEGRVLEGYPVVTALVIINGKQYCRTMSSDAAMNHSYAYSSYMTDLSGKLVTFNFAIVTTSCGVYDEVRMAECKKEREAYSYTQADKMVEDLVDKMVASVKFTQEKVTFDVPTALGLKYYSVSSANGGWPPKVTTTSEVYSCKVEKIPTVGETQERIISDRRYCVMSESDGSTGYHLFSYRTMIGYEYARIDFIVWGGRCGPIGDPSKRDACSNETKILDSKVDNMVDGIVRSIKIAK